MAARADKHKFASEITSAIASVHKSLLKSAQLLKNPNAKLPKSRLAQIYNDM